MNQDLPIFSVRNLSVSFPSSGSSQRAVNNVSFDVTQGKTLAIVGESGSGKTVSSLSMLSLLQKGKAIFDSGKFVFQSSSFSSEKDAVIEISPENDILKTLRGKSIAMIFQEPMTSLNPVMKCGEQVCEMLRAHFNISREKALIRTLELFREVKLPRAEEMLDQYPHQLSGGQRQRVMIAMSISCNPKILIADEPTTALDVTVQKEILLLLKSLQIKHNMALVFITHDLGVVEEIADEIIVMRRGEIVEQGIARDILSNPKHAYTKGLLACRPEPGKKTQKLMTIDAFIGHDTEEHKTRNAHLFSKQKILDVDDKLLEVKNLTKTYDGGGGLFHKKQNQVRAVNGVSFEIFRGETLGLVGESGCGKTTLSRMLLGLIPSSEGEIIFRLPKEPSLSFDITKISQTEIRKLRKDIQIIFQDPYSALNPKHTIGTAIMEPMIVFGLHGDLKSRKKKVIDLLEKVGLGEEHFGRYPHEFSGGQRQRVVIARALACEPSFIICDESVSALDVSVQAQVLNLLNDLKRDFSLTYLFISHDLNVVYYMSDRIMVMNKGMIEEIGPCDDVFFRPSEEYTKRLLAAIPGR